MKNLSFKIYCCVSVLLGSFLVNTNDGHARITFKESTVYYNVSGKTGAELYKSMEKNGPRHGSGGKQVLAATSFTFDFKNVRTGKKGKFCVIKNIDIIVGVKFTYPKLRNKGRLSREARKAWDNFIKVAVKHEKHHVTITRNFIKAYEKVLLSSKRRLTKNCGRPSLGETFKTNRMVRNHERQHIRFDKKDLKAGGRAYKALQRLVNAN